MRHHPEPMGVLNLPSPPADAPLDVSGGEALERTFPTRVLRFRIREGNGGVGLPPGGDGIERDLQVLEDVTVSLITERRVSRPPGLWGGDPGAPDEHWLLPGGRRGASRTPTDKCTRRLKAGGVLRMLTPGGGGWGPATGTGSS